MVVTAMLALGAVPLPRWYWTGLAAGLSAGVVFVHWLIFQSLYRFGALCPYCMAVWAVTIPLWLTALGRAGASPALRAWTWPAAAV